jgi:hypothetical protein
MNGKGDAPRPSSVDHNTFANNWNKIFGGDDVGNASVKRVEKQEACEDSWGQQDCAVSKENVGGSRDS